MFSAGSPLGSRELGKDVPVTFEPLSVGNLICSQPQPPGPLCSATVQEVVTDSGVMGYTTTYTPPGFRTTHSFELTGNRGAALVTKYSTYREDAESQSAFEEYTKRYHESWVTFARIVGHGDDVRPILVSGVDLTGDFSMMAYSNPDQDIHDISQFSAFPEDFFDPYSPWGIWETGFPTHTNRGPQIPSGSQPRYAMGIPAEFDQCIFVRYYSMGRGPLGLFPKVIRV